jgi:hypothetical protein
MNSCIPEIAHSLLTSVKIDLDYALNFIAKFLKPQTVVIVHLDECQVGIY